MERFDIQTIVIGAGVIGLACARELALSGHEVMVVENAKAIGTETSSRNSEVIHAGIYYPENSLKARFCVEGKHKLYDYLDTHKIPYRRCGKLIVASGPDQTDALQTIKSKAEKNGVPDLIELDSAGAKIYEPEVKADAALFSPSTGIFDTHSFMLALQGDLEDAGGSIAFDTKILSITAVKDALEITVQNGNDITLITAQNVINAAGHGGLKIAQMIDGFPEDHIPKQYFAKGHYFALQGKNPFSHLVYPVPEPDGLGVHVTLDLGGKARFGPDVKWLDTLDYSFDADRAEHFYPAIRRYWPALKDGTLVPDYVGIRPKISGPGEPAADFMIEGPDAHGMQGLINLFGIESPGLTASLAIGAHIQTMVS